MAASRYWPSGSLSCRAADLFAHHAAMCIRMIRVCPEREGLRLRMAPSGGFGAVAAYNQRHQPRRMRLRRVFAPPRPQNTAIHRPSVSGALPQLHRRRRFAHGLWCNPQTRCVRARARCLSSLHGALLLLVDRKMAKSPRGPFVNHTLPEAYVCGWHPYVQQFARPPAEQAAASSRRDVCLRFYISGLPLHRLVALVVLCLSHTLSTFPRSTCGAHCGVAANQVADEPGSREGPHFPTPWTTYQIGNVSVALS
ncbi:hypothetical protein P171DRAFT_505191 [Karstenula rhodostoma CBS 690.94]|uniref:Uncharacterized protein n=1 Tax=Karstenula rhodostoma CBS 690.94 TaxID=1392251 RepID=A0A9P4U6K1_9PLEO|nr:hypothetical protein P171DRAFT_505191 [Karstenula rhodostoma CBS 690.94]